MTRVSWYSSQQQQLGSVLHFSVNVCSVGALMTAPRTLITIIIVIVIESS